jgi:hypothetical protein
MQGGCASKGFAGRSFPRSKGTAEIPGGLLDIRLAADENAIQQQCTDYAFHSTVQPHTSVRLPAASAHRIEFIAERPSCERQRGRAAAIVIPMAV